MKIFVKVMLHFQNYQIIELLLLSNFMIADSSEQGEQIQSIR